MTKNYETSKEMSKTISDIVNNKLRSKQEIDIDYSKTNKN